MDNGYVYILTNQSIPDQLKIGMTKRDSRVRARELSTTSVPTPFQVAFEVFCENCQFLESQVHAELADFRVSINREFFRYPLDKAITLLLRLNKELTEPENKFQAVDIMDSLNEKFPDSLREDIVAVRIVQPEERVWLEITTERVSLNGYMIDQTITRTDLAFIGDYEPDEGSDPDNETYYQYFDNQDNIQVNVQKFLDEFGKHSISMVTDLFKDDVCDEIFKEYNKTRKSEKK